MTSSIRQIPKFRVVGCPRFPEFGLNLVDFSTCILSPYNGLGSLIMYDVAVVPATSAHMFIGAPTISIINFPSIRLFISGLVLGSTRGPLRWPSNPLPELHCRYNHLLTVPSTVYVKTDHQVYRLVAPSSGPFSCSTLAPSMISP